MSLESTSLPPIPNEIWIQILHHLSLQDFWLSARLLNRQWRTYVEIHSLETLVSRSTIGVSLSLGNGAHHRWYDVRATLTFSYIGTSPQNPRCARFGKCSVQPHHQCDRSMKVWQKMCQIGLNRKQEWRLQCGDEGELRKTRLPDVALGEDDTLHIDWRKLLTAYFVTGTTCFIAQQVNKPCTIT
nr:hypothetical protein CFP56_71021 [Quercus suber]